jgi:hypothetical protein
MKRLLALFPLLLITTGCWSNESSWQDLGMVENQDAAHESSTPPADRPALSSLQQYRRMTLDEDGLRAVLKPTTSGSGKADAPNIHLPLPNGSFASVTATLTETLAPEIAAQHPEIQTWKVFGADGKVISGVIDFNSQGFHAMLDLPNGDTVFIDPQEVDGNREYASFSKQSNPVAFQNPGGEF